MCKSKWYNLSKEGRGDREGWQREKGKGGGLNGLMVSVRWNCPQCWHIRGSEQQGSRELDNAMAEGMARE